MGFRLGLAVVGIVIRSKKIVVRIERGEALQDVVDADLGGVFVANRGQPANREQPYDFSEDQILLRRLIAGTQPHVEVLRAPDRLGKYLPEIFKGATGVLQWHDAVAATAIEVLMQVSLGLELMRALAAGGF